MEELDLGALDSLFKSFGTDSTDSGNYLKWGEETKTRYPHIEGVNWDEPFTIICESFDDRLITFSYIKRNEWPLNCEDESVYTIHEEEDYEENPNIHWDGEDFFTYDTKETPIPSWKFREEKTGMKFRFNG